MTLYIENLYRTWYGVVAFAHSEDKALLRSNLSAERDLAKRWAGSDDSRPPMQGFTSLENQSVKPSPELCSGGIHTELFPHRIITFDMDTE